MKVKPDWKQVASTLLFSTKSFSLKGMGLVYRKGKGVTNLNNAMKKALNKGMGKTEYELSMLELYVQDVLKGV